ncbi:MAG: hypothetical protein F4087_13780 [Gemmatimonadetes bacterium]|nr:hypothetical protein [Dehalococcoidia bacterium]MYE67919.1 hypothetical protein [Acidimicrobiia bacterium]MYJ69559.1 hypothetical protein [Gemmatimonadota bacterium]
MNRNRRTNHWRAGCAERRTSGSAGGRRKSAPTGVTRRRPTRLVGQRVIYQGNDHSSIVRPAEVLRPAVLVAAPHIIVAHNHPSQDPSPSPQDIRVTKDIAEAAKLLGVTLLDHVVIGGPDGAVSLKDRGLF